MPERKPAPIVDATAENVVQRVREMTEGLGGDTAYDAIGSEKAALQVIEAWPLAGRAGRHAGFCDPDAGSISRTYRFDQINEGFGLMPAGEVARGVRLRLTEGRAGQDWGNSL